MKNIFYILFFIVIFFAITFVRRQKRDIYFIPSYVPDGYVLEELDNNVVSGSMGLGYMIKFQNGLQNSLEITTYKEPIEYMDTCKNGDIGKFRNVKIIAENGIDLCSYEYVDVYTNRQYYLNRDGKTVRIIDNGFSLNQETVIKMVNSLTKKYW